EEEDLGDEEDPDSHPARIELRLRAVEVMRDVELRRKRDRALTALGMRLSAHSVLTSEGLLAAPSGRRRSRRGRGSRPGPGGNSPAGAGTAPPTRARCRPRGWPAPSRPSATTGGGTPP